MTDSSRRPPGSEPGSEPGSKDEAGGEQPFAFDELFYSRTDPRGVIVAGNEVFRRVSGFDWNDLLGAPHKIVRHRDTPRGMFRILWNALGRGDPMGAYIKNRTKAGEWYWVFAILMPVEGEYLSVRLKPSSPVFTEIRNVYAQLSERERRESLDPEVSAGLLRQFAAERGFSSYSSFMAYALGQELAARGRQLKRPDDPRCKKLLAMNNVLERAAREQAGLLRSFEALQSVPNNMRIVASRLEPAGGPVSTISENYKMSSTMISDRLRSFVAGRDNLCDQMSREVARALFLMGSQQVIEEMVSRFDMAESVPGIDGERERALMMRLEQKCAQDAEAAMIVSSGHAGQLIRTSRDLRRNMLGLDTIRVLGRVECGRMRGNSGGLSATIDQLDAFHDDIKTRLEAITRLSEEIEQSITGYLWQQAA